MLEYLIRGDDGEPDLGLDQSAIPESLIPDGWDYDWSIGPDGYRLRVGSVGLVLVDEPGFGWQVEVEGSTGAEQAAPVVQAIADRISQRLGRPTRVVEL